MIEEARTLWETHGEDAQQAQAAWGLLYLVAYRNNCRIPLEATEFANSAEQLERCVIEQREEEMEALSLQELQKDLRRIESIAGYINEVTDVSMMSIDIDATIGSPFLMDCREPLLRLTDKYGIACDLSSDAASAAHDVMCEIAQLMASKTATTAQMA